MTGIGAQDAAVAAKKAQDSELVALKQQMDRLKADISPGPSAKQKLRKACTDFEAVFISKLWEQMRATIPKDGMLHSPQEDMYRSMFDREFTEKMAADGGIGLGDMLYDQLQGKLKGGGKSAGKTGAQTLQSSLASTHPVTPETSGAVPEKPGFKTPRRAGTGLSTASAATSVPTNSSAPATASAVASSSAAASPKPPASVPGAVMADVEALAQRIEADYDRRQAEAAARSLQGAAPAATVSSAQSPAARYGQGNAATTGRRFATVG